MCMFDYVKRTNRWREDPSLSLNDNLFLGSVHFAELFFNKFKIKRHNNEHDYDDMAADCSIAVYESAKKHIDTWDKNYRLDQYIYYRAWSTVGQWLKNYFRKKQMTPLDVPKISDNRLTAVDYDVGIDEIGSNNYEQGTRYTVFKESPLSYYEKKLSIAAQGYLEYRDECIDMGIDPVDPEDYLTNKNSLGTDLKYLGKILLNESPKTKDIQNKISDVLG